MGVAFVTEPWLDTRMNNTHTTTSPDYISDNGITETEALNALTLLGGIATAGEVVRVALELRAA